ncbi:GGDEF domain-containing protein [Oricola sp.]|uniref:GGDEF domain-containing protein n=1 Tax=Oricola sp. TaxID=1979950 RepID=UPI0025D38518|nr:GGDEF domain-containing protein [Oricola sp.]MCI5075011.1 GGDEF domain-containing protein [Oricola sp.]
MQIQSYFQLISPVIFLVFACGFLVVSHYAREIAAARIFSASYFFIACALIADYLRGLQPQIVEIYLINTLYTAGSALFCVALFTFYRGRAPLRLIVGTCIAMLIGLTVFRFVQDEIAGRIVVMDVGIASMFIYAAYDMRHLMRRPVDRILQTLVALNGAQLITRTVLMLWFEGGVLTQFNYAESFSAMSMQFVVSVLALVVAANLFMIFGMEIVKRLTLTSETDPLTGLLNRRGFERQMPALADRIAEGGLGHAVVLADIDRFKAINDRHGHEAGDDVIMHFARMLACLAREEDFVVRWGGEEFMIVMPMADKGIARLYAESVRSALEALRHDSLGGENVTASFGVAVWTRGRRISDAVQGADHALYRAKRTGRNRVCLHGAETQLDTRQEAVA